MELQAQGLYQRSSSKVKQFVRLWRNVGPLYAVSCAIKYATPDFLFGAYKGVIVRVDFTTMPRNGMDSKEGVRWATIEDIEDIADLGSDQSHVSKLFKRGHDFAVAERDGKIIGFECYQRSVTDQDSESQLVARELWLRTQLSSEQVWCVNAYVDPTYRGQGIITDLLIFAAAHYARLGCECAFGTVEADNTVAARAHEKRGFVPIGHIDFVRILNFVFLRLGKDFRIGLWSSKRPLILPARLYHY